VFCESGCSENSSLCKEVHEMLTYFVHFSCDFDKIWYRRFPQNSSFVKIDTLIPLVLINRLKTGCTLFYIRT
jgi:hypothetical protein